MIQLIALAYVVVTGDYPGAAAMGAEEDSVLVDTLLNLHAALGL